MAARLPLSSITTRNRENALFGQWQIMSTYDENFVSTRELTEDNCSAQPSHDPNALPFPETRSDKETLEQRPQRLVGGLKTKQAWLRRHVKHGGLQGLQPRHITDAI